MTAGDPGINWIQIQLEVVETWHLLQCNAMAHIDIKNIGMQILNSPSFKQRSSAV